MDNFLNPISREERMLEAQKRYQGLGTIIKRRNLSLWSLDKTSGKVSKCELGVRKKVVAMTDLGPIPIKKSSFTIKPNNEYLQALNKKNALRKFKALQRRGIIAMDIEIS